MTVTSGTRAAGEPPPAVSAAAGMSWDDLLAGLGLGALVALVALRAGKALRRRATPVGAQAS